MHRAGASPSCSNRSSGPRSVETPDGRPATRGLERASSSSSAYDAVLREREAKDEVGKVLAAVRKVYERKLRSSSTTDDLAARVPEVRKLMKAQEVLKHALERCRRMGLEIGLVAPPPQ